MTLINDEVNLINEKLKGDPKMMELMKKLEENPENNSIRYELAVLQFTNGIFEEAIENSLDVLTKINSFIQMILFF